MTRTFGILNNSQYSQRIISFSLFPGNSKIAKKTGVKHVALCPWFAETGIIDSTTKELVMKKSPLKFVSVEKVGEALQLAVEEQK